MKKTKKNILFIFLKGALRFFVLTVISSAMVTLLDAAIPQIVRLTVDSVIGSEPLQLPTFMMDIIARLGGVEALRSKLYLIAILVCVTALCASVFKYLTRVFNARGSETMVETMRNRLFSHIQKLPFSWHVKNQTGDIIQRCTSDVETVRVFVADHLIDMFRIILLISFSLIIMFSMNVKIALIALSFMPVVLVSSVLFFKKIGSKFTEADEADGVLSTIAQENLTGVRVVRAFGRERYERDKFEKQNGIYTRLYVQLGKIMSWFWGIGDFVCCAQIMVVIIVGITEAVAGRITTGEFIAFVSYSGMLVWPVRRLGRIISEMSKAKVSISRLRYILNSDEEQDKPDAVSPDMNGDIEFTDINFGYSEDMPILKDVSFKIEAGTTFGILGGTGSGKSTLMHLLNRLYDLPSECGKISIGGIDIADMKASWVRQNIGMVLQEPFLFSRSIEDNIGITKEEMTLTDIRNAAKIACVDDTITAFSDGYSTVIGERGVTLSGGQKQRVAIARTLTLKTPIVVFDDSLSAVDTETDTKIRRALNESVLNSTVILISHRINSLMHADKVLVLDKGTVAQIGTHAELIACDGIYKDIYTLQSSTVEEA